MTNKEAIEILKNMGKIGPYEQYEAICMAISALEKQEQKKPLTVGDRIRAMADEELAKFLPSHLCPPSRIHYGKKNKYTECPTDGRIQNCADCWLDHLRQEAK